MVENRPFGHILAHAILWIGIAANMHSALAGVSLWGGTILLTWVGAHLSFGVSVRKRKTILRTLAETLAVQARESIAAATPKLGRPS